MLDRYDQDLLLDYLEDELDADRRAQLDALLAQDPQLASLLRELASDRAALRALPVAQAPGDLVHDVTQALERRMLLDDQPDDIAPIPLARGRSMASPPPRSFSWGRIIGLSGLAASVALAAGIVVITLDDSLQRTAHELASGSTPPESDRQEAANTFAADASETSEDATRASDRAEATRERAAAPFESEPADHLRFHSQANGKPAAESIKPEALALGNTPEPGLNPIGLPDGLNASKPNAEREKLALTPAPTRTRKSAAIAAITPRQQLVLMTESPEISRDQLVAFCVTNGIPIVQPDQADAPLADTPRSLTLDEQTQTSDADPQYALLINENQLKQLIDSLNRELALAPDQAGKGPVISSQAALLAPLPGHIEDHDIAILLQGAPALDNAEKRALDPQSDEALSSTDSPMPQAVKLRSPDLGSPYANTRNDYNLSQAYTHLFDPTPSDSLSTLQDQADRSGSGLESRVAEATALPAAQAADSALVQPDPAVEDDQEIVEAQPKSVGTPQPELELAQRDESKLERMPDDASFELSPKAIDPTRGNWLSAHLPFADTTPLLLERRSGRSAGATKLIPVVIRKADTQEVNSLRQRQQAELQADQPTQPADASEQADHPALPEPTPATETPQD